MGKKGFTLIELTIVMAIVTVLLGTAAPVAVKRVQIAYAQKAAQEMNILQDAAKNYYATNDRWPGTPLVGTPEQISEKVIQDLKGDGYLSPTWVAENTWGPYVLAPAADGKSFSVASNIPSDLQGVLTAALPQSSPAAGVVTSFIPIPGEEASLQSLVHRSSTDPQYREMSQRLVTPTVVGESGATAYGMNFDKVNSDSGSGGSGLDPGKGRMKDIWVETLNSGAGGYVGDIAGADIAVGTGVLSHGQQIPLPTFADSTQATQAQCKWIVSMSKGGGTDTHEHRWEYCYTNANRVVTSMIYYDAYGWVKGTANYMIIGAK